MPQKTNVQLVDVGGVCNPVTGGVGQAVDGHTIIATDTVLLPNPPNGLAYAGPWIAAVGAWTRSTDWDSTADITPGDWWYIEQGNIYQGTQWHFEDTVAPATINTTPITIGMMSRRRALEEGPGISIDGTTPPLVSWTDPTEIASSFVEGLNVEYLSANSIRIRAGAAYIPQSGVANITTDTDLTGLALTASTWYYIYAYDAGGGVLAFDAPSTQAPQTTPYRGGAKAKGPEGTPDLTRRYVPNSAFYASASNTMRRFWKRGEWTRWVVSQTGVVRISRTTNPSTITDTSIASLCPPTGEEIRVSAYVLNNINNATLYVSTPDDGFIGAAGGTAPTAGQIAVGPVGSANAQRVQGAGTIVMGATKSIREAQSAGAAGGSSENTVDILGYWEGRV